jgi:signal peptidase I
MDNPNFGVIDEVPVTPSKGSRFLRGIVEILIALVIAVILSFLVRTFVIDPFLVPTGSMETTIMTGDRILAEKITFKTRPVQANDIVVFVDKADPSRVLVKRVIAVGGQTVDLRNGSVFVDDKVLYEPYTQGQRSEPLPTQLDGVAISYPFTVPEGYIWVMGDNRERSQDSRYFGAIDADTVLARAIMVIWPADDIGMLN